MFKVVYLANEKRKLKTVKEIIKGAMSPIFEQF
jgi:hypothetical protein